MIISSIGKRHINGHKELTAHKEVVDFKQDKDICSEVYFPVLAPNGKVMEVLVKENDAVKIGTVLCKRTDFYVPIYSSVSGKVKGVKSLYNSALGKNCDHLVIENDFKYTKSLLKTIDYKNSDKEIILNAIKEAGIVGLGGAGFPTYVKYSSDAQINSLLINGVECEPFLTTDYITMKNNVNHLLEGVSILMKLSGANEAIIAFKNNKKDLKELIEKDLVNYPGIKIVEVKDRYPMGWEKLLVKTVYKKTYDKLPSEIGVIVNNAQTAISVAKALIDGDVISERLLTVSGDAVNPTNVVVPVGTLAKNILEKCGYLAEEVCVLAGGPMTSKSNITDEFAIQTNNGGLTIMKKKVYQTLPCLKCGKCIENCPAGLQPIQIKNAFDDKDAKELQAFDCSKCVECGMCSFVCPSHIELTDAIKKAKLYLRVSATNKGGKQ